MLLAQALQEPMGSIAAELQLTSPPPQHPHLVLCFPTPQILLIILNRPKLLNAITIDGHWALHKLLEWYDGQPSLRCAIMTGRGRAFSVGADLKEWNFNNAEKQEDIQTRVFPPSGFGAISKRTGKRPVILAVNGMAVGGGTEMVVNADIAIASTRATLQLPEVKRGVAAIAGALARLVRVVGRTRAMEMALTGRPVPAEEAWHWGIVSQVVNDKDEKEPHDAGGDIDPKEIEKAVMKRKLTQSAIAMAKVIASNSPDSVIVSRAGVNLGWEGAGAEEGSRLLVEEWGRRLYAGQNMKEGIKAFVERRDPKLGRQQALSAR